MVRIALGVVIVALMVSFVVGAHWYLVQRLVLDLGLGAGWARLGVACTILLGLLLALQPVGERLLRPPISRAIAWPASLWLGLAFYLLVLLLGSDLLLWLGGSAAAAAGQEATVGSADHGLARARSGLVVAGALAFVAVGLRSGLAGPSLRRIELALPRWPAARDGFRIVQISDIHIGPILDRRFARELVERVNALEPDLIAVTGDLVDGSVAKLADEVAPFAGLSAACGVYFVTGNHDHLSGARSWTKHVAKLGMRVLRNEHTIVGEEDAAFTLAGVDDHRGSMMGGDGGEDLDSALAGVDPELAVVLLAHDPSTFKRASSMGIDLQISGHTHGGQIWPFGWLVRLVVPFVAGLHRRGRATLYVSCGTGFWGPPMRLAAPAEITEIVLRRARPGTPTGSPRQEESR